MNPQVEVRLWLPREVNDWLHAEGDERFMTRNGYIKWLLVGLYRKSKEVNRGQ